MSGERIPGDELTRLLSLKRYRDESTHPKQTVAAMSLNELAQRLNKFTFSIAVPFFSLHRAFRFQVPSIILRAAYAPMVEIRSANGAA